MAKTEDTTNSVNTKAKFNGKIMHQRADKLADVMVETFGYSNTYLLLDYARILTEQKQLKHDGVEKETPSESEE